MSDETGVSVKSKIKLRPVQNRADWRLFLECQPKIRCNDPAYIRPLDRQVLDNAHPRKCAFLKRNPSQAWVALADGEPVGRVMAIHNLEHQEKYGAYEGHFGFFECINDQTIASQLLDCAANWLRARNLTAMAGPYNSSINHECGLLIEGNGGEPTLGLDQSPIWYAALFEGWGLALQKRLVSSIGPTEIGTTEKYDARIRRLAKGAGLSVKPLRWHHYWSGMNRFFEIFDEAWVDNWGSLPTQRSDRRQLILALLPIFAPGCVNFIMKDGEEVAMSLQVPNVLESMKQANGKLFPLTWLRVLRDLFLRRYSHGRIMILGVRPRWQRSSAAALATLLLIDEARTYFRRNKIKTWEAGWMLEENHGVRALNDLRINNEQRTFGIYSRKI